MNSPVKIAVFSFVMAFLVSLSHPATVFFYLPKCTRRTRWIQNNPSYTIFLLSSFPAAVCVFAATINVQVLAWIVNLFVAGYFWYLAFLLIKSAQEGTPPSEDEKERLVFIFGLLVTWFPMRLHTEWYQNEFHRPHWLRRYSAFWIVAFLALAYLLFVVLILKPEGKFVLIVAAVAPTLLAAVGKLKPEWLRSGSYINQPSYAA